MGHSNNNAFMHISPKTHILFNDVESAMPLSHYYMFCLLSETPAIHSPSPCNAAMDIWEGKRNSAQKQNGNGIS